MSLKEVFVDRLEKRMSEKGWKRKDLISCMEKLDNDIVISKNTYNKWFQKKDARLPEPENLALICKALNCTLDYLYGNIDTLNPNRNYIHEYTGLSDEAIIAVKKIPFLTNLISYMILHPELLQLIEEYIYAKSERMDIRVVSSEQTETQIPGENGNIKYDIDTLVGVPLEINSVQELKVNGRKVDKEVIRRTILDSIRDELNEMSNIISNNLREESKKIFRNITVRHL